MAPVRVERRSQYSKSRYLSQKICHLRGFLRRNESNFKHNHNSSVLGSNGIAQGSVTFAKSNIIPDTHKFNIKMIDDIK